MDKEKPPIPEKDRYNPLGGHHKKGDKGSSLDVPSWQPPPKDRPKAEPTPPETKE